MRRRVVIMPKLISNSTVGICDLLGKLDCMYRPDVMGDDRKPYIVMNVAQDWSLTVLDPKSQHERQSSPIRCMLRQNLRLWSPCLSHMFDTTLLHVATPDRISVHLIISNWQLVPSTHALITPWTTTVRKYPRTCALNSYFI